MKFVDLRNKMLLLEDESLEWIVELQGTGPETVFYDLGIHERNAKLNYDRFYVHCKDGDYLGLYGLYNQTEIDLIWWADGNPGGAVKHPHLSVHWIDKDDAVRYWEDRLGTVWERDGEDLEIEGVRDGYIHVGIWEVEKIYPPLCEKCGVVSNREGTQWVCPVCRDKKCIK